MLSLDTWRSEVASAASPVGLDLVNDTWAGHDPDLVHVAAQCGAGVVVSHTGGLPPRTDPVDVTYGPDPLDVVHDVLRTLAAGAEKALAAGIPASRVLVDPTLDFGKTTAHSLEVLRHTADVVALGFPVLQAISRKDFVGESLGLEAPDRLEGAWVPPRSPRGSAPPCSAPTTCGRPAASSTWWRPYAATGHRGGPNAGCRARPEGEAATTLRHTENGRFRPLHERNLRARFLPVAVAVPRSSKKSARCRTLWRVLLYPASSTGRGRVPLGVDGSRTCTQCPRPWSDRKK